MVASMLVRHTVGSIMLLLLLAFSRPVIADPANVSGLKGQDLATAKLDLTHFKLDKGTLSDIFGGLFSKNKGKITGVHVVEDRADSLTIQVSFSGLKADDLTLSAQAEADDGQPLKTIAKGSSKLTSHEGQVELKLDIDPSVAQGTKLSESVLIIEVGPGNAVQPDVLKGFKCPKQWEKRLTDLVVEATPVGVGPRQGANPHPSRYIFLKPYNLSRMTTRPNTFSGVGSVPNNSTQIAQPSPTLAPGQRFRPISHLRIRQSYPLPQDVKDKNGKGPGNDVLKLFDTLAVEPGIPLNAEDVMDLHPYIYEDANPDSGFFYYLPRRYYLSWSPDNGYGLRILYNAAKTDTAAATVSIAATLTSGIDTADITLARDQLQHYCATAGRPFTALKPFPFNTMAVSLKDDVQKQYNIPPENITVGSISDIAGTIDLSISTDPVTKENLQLALTQGLGINGLVTYQSAVAEGGQPLEVKIPMAIKFADPHSFGTSIFRRDVKFKNASPYDMTLKYVHVLMSETTPRAYTYDCKNSVVPSGGTATINGIPAWLDTAPQTMKMWVDYGVVADDAVANQKAIDTVTGGVVSIDSSTITFRTLTPFADSGAASILVNVSSKYFATNSNTAITKTVELDKDSGTFKLGPIYLRNRQAGEDKPGDPLFKYNLSVVMKDGTVKESAGWTESNKLTLFIGKKQVQDALGVTDTPAAPPDHPAAPPDNP